MLGSAMPFHDIGSGNGGSDRASREEEKALVAICSYAAVGQRNRLAKAHFRDRGAR